MPTRARHKHELSGGNDCGKATRSALQVKQPFRPLERLNDELGVVQAGRGRHVSHIEYEKSTEIVVPLDPPLTSRLPTSTRPTHSSLVLVEPIAAETHAIAAQSLFAEFYQDRNMFDRAQIGYQGV